MDTPRLNPELRNAIEEALLRRNGRRIGDEIQCQCPSPASHTRGDANPSFSFNTVKGLFICRACGAKGNVRALAKALGIPLSGRVARTVAIDGSGWRETQRWTVREASGVPVAVHVRRDRPGCRKQCLWELPDGTPGLKGRKLSSLPLYGCERLAASPGARVAVCEGEKATDALTTLGFLAVGTVTGSSSAPDAEVLAILTGRDVILWPDADVVGRQHMQRIADRLLTLGTSPRRLELPNAAPCDDAADYRGTSGDLKVLLDAAPSWTASDSERAAPVTPTLALRTSVDLLSFTAGWELWHTPDGIAYATIPVSDREKSHSETHRLNSPAIRNALTYAAYRSNGRSPRRETISDALDTLHGRARYDGAEHMVHVRLASHGAAIYLDLADASWQVVEITPDGWRVVGASPVHFRRPRGLAALPEPVAGGRLDDLRALLTLSDDDSWHLLVAWLLAAFQPSGPYPVLALHGEQGSAKSTTARILRSLVDPSTVPLRAEPRNVGDLAIAAANGWMLAFDNLSRVAPWLSDALCRIATGGGYSTRELYSDDSEVLLDAQRPMVLTGIEDLTTRDDLADRTIVVTLPPIDDDARRPEAELWAEVEALRPRLLGTLLDGITAALRHRNAPRPSRLPRMADAAVWVSRAAPALGLDPARILCTWRGQRRETATTAIEASAIGRAIVAHMATRERWEGAGSELLAVLAQYIDTETRRDRAAWPQSPRGLTGALQRLAPALRLGGIGVEWPPRDATPARRRLVRLIRTEARQDRPDRPDRSEVVSTGRSVDGRSGAAPSMSSNPEVPSAGSSDGMGGLDGSAGGFGDWEVIA